MQLLNDTDKIRMDSAKISAFKRSIRHGKYAIVSTFSHKDNANLFYEIISNNINCIVCVRVSVLMSFHSSYKCAAITRSAKKNSKKCTVSSSDSIASQITINYSHFYSSVRDVQHKRMRVRAFICVRSVRV